MSERTPLELELHSYVDGALDDDAMAEIERYLEREPLVAAKVKEFLLHKSHIRAYAESAAATQPSQAVAELEKRLAKRLKPTRRWSWTRVPVLAALFAVGWVGHAVYAPLTADPAYTDEVIRAHVLATTLPVQLWPASPERIGEMFARIGERQSVPDLTSLGLQPFAAQLVPTDEGFAIQLTYRGGDGALLSYFVLHDDYEDHEVAPHAVQRDGITLVYWQHSRTRYAVAAPEAADRLVSIVRLIDPTSET